ncbi:MAG: SDR family oxidoreductase [Burkholderiales bacterium]|nr:SDR family oxidoreductase [Burkholderiales bacterium]
MSASRKIAIVTGSSRGIGAATARLLSARGYDVCVNYRNDRDAADAVARGIVASGARAITVQADTGIEDDVRRLFAAVDEQLGTVDALVNNAGVMLRGDHYEEFPFADMRRLISTNVLGYLYCASEAIRRMSQRTGGRGGAIVNVSSSTATRSHRGGVVYGASKGAVNSLTLGLAAEVARHGIRVNTCSPGLTDTDLPPPGFTAKMAPTLPMGRAAKAEEAALAIAWLLSDEATYVSGANLQVMGGLG